MPALMCSSAYNHNTSNAEKPRDAWHYLGSLFVHRKHIRTELIISSWIINDRGPRSDKQYNGASVGKYRIKILELQEIFFLQELTMSIELNFSPNLVQIRP